MISENIPLLYLLDQTNSQLRISQTHKRKQMFSAIIFQLKNNQIQGKTGRMAKTNYYLTLFEVPATGHPYKADIGGW